MSFTTYVVLQFLNIKAVLCGLSQTILGLTGERTVKRLRLSKGITVPDSTSIYDACRRMAGCRVDVLLLTDSNALLCGILMDKDITTRVIACEVNIQETPVSKDMTKHHVFVLSDTLVVEALQKMVLVVENGEVIALLDIAKCLYDAVAHLERASEKGKAIVAAVEGVEKNWGASVSGWLSNILSCVIDYFTQFMRLIDGHCK
ncbi:hypothetical protein KY290_029762 [Solanum tuberosum]|uniref:CBS domain-containing protein n=1 Tax=Solanum tuberosum TaxID=4113 RepID=A0ABQ7ULM6_SOLTU|nr:hypothetical protein KY289_028981 [Solanum tuberosum]KAH0663885.1 hypothetical protein KY284_028816 [Solanum tuberosum]KAH0750530.1 hypothetical protein KY290_029762 [Solanum tuberosum]